MEPFIKSISFHEIKERESSVQENPPRDMFTSASSRVLNSSELEYEETQPSARWQLPRISAFEVYSNLSAFHLTTATRISIKESISQIQEKFRLCPIHSSSKC